ncbi:hypothetical protein VNO78_35206 [Psophocarpus tetragonolobus]|uniref:Uncharacterized protein n=1 Tax=Psophocarpus tetragonolobus TaxID=3891 RepID=A0AAN9RKD8_PSOTE
MIGGDDRRKISQGGPEEEGRAGLRSIGPPLRIYGRKGFGLAWFMSIDEGSQIALDRRLVAWVRILHLRKDKGEGVLERGNPRLRGQITPSSLIQLGLVCSQRETLPHVFQFESHPVFSMSSSLSGGRHSSIAFITEGPNPKNKSIKRLDLSDLTIVSLEARST